MNPTIYKYLGILVVVIGMLGTAYYKGYSKEHDKLVTYQAQVAQAAKDQNAASELKDKQNKEQANEAENQYTTAINGINDWYLAHPVIRMRDPNTCSGELPKTTSDPKGADGSAASFYVSPYSPELTELIAAQLNELQQRLIAGGVTVE